MSDIHLTFRWSDQAGYAKPSQADVDRLKKIVDDAGGFDVTVADFLRDVMNEATHLYREVLSKQRNAARYADPS